ncbi:MAG: hypothetical protein ACLR2O_00365 [Coprococcus sp.]
MGGKGAGATRQKRRDSNSFRGNVDETQIIMETIADTMIAFGG